MPFFATRYFAASRCRCADFLQFSPCRQRHYASCCRHARFSFAFSYFAIIARAAPLLMFSMPLLAAASLCCHDDGWRLRHATFRLMIRCFSCFAFTPFSPPILFSLFAIIFTPAADFLFHFSLRFRHSSPLFRRFSLICRQPYCH